MGVPTLSLHHALKQEPRQVRQHKRAGVIVKTKNRKQHVVTRPLAPGRDTDETERLMIYPYFVTFILRPNAALDNQIFHAEPQSLLSRRDDTCERLRPLRSLRPYEESNCRGIFFSPSRQGRKGEA